MIIPHNERRVFWSDEDNCWIATFSKCDEFRLLSAFGDTPADAMSELDTVLKAVIEIYAKQRRELPSDDPS